MLDGNASTVETIWSLFSLVAMLLHGWLSAQAYLDWRATWTRVKDQAASFREDSAGWYLWGQILLFVPQIIFLWIGVTAMTLPPSQAERQEGTSSALQIGLIVAEAMLLAASVAFWMARRVLDQWDAHHAETHPAS